LLQNYDLILDDDLVLIPISEINVILRQRQPSKPSMLLQQPKHLSLKQRQPR